MIRSAFASLLLIGGIGLAAGTHAQMAASPATFTQFGNSCGFTVDSFLGLNPWDACLPHTNGEPQLNSLSDVWLILLPLLADAIKIAGYTAVGFVIWGGVKYIKSQGDPGQFNEARQIIYNALFGLLLALISVAIVNFISGAIH